MCLLAQLYLLQQKLHFYSSFMGLTLKVQSQTLLEKDVAE